MSRRQLVDLLDDSTVFLNDTQHSGGQTRSVLAPLPRVLTLYFPHSLHSSFSL